MLSLNQTTDTLTFLIVNHVVMHGLGGTVIVQEHRFFSLSLYLSLEGIVKQRNFRHWQGWHNWIIFLTRWSPSFWYAPLYIAWVIFLSSGFWYTARVSLNICYDLLSEVEGRCNGGCFVILNVVLDRLGVANHFFTIHIRDFRRILDLIDYFEVSLKVVR